MRKIAATIALLLAVLLPSSALAAEHVPESARETCNSLEYFGYMPEPVVKCYRAVAAELGWWDTTVSSWEWFLVMSPSGVTQGESMQCWNVNRGEYVDVNEPCLSDRPQKGTEDAGFGQIVSDWWGQGGYLCESHGYCGRDSITVSPYTSMRTMLLLVEVSGSDPWCWNDRMILYHRCSDAPDRT